MKNAELKALINHCMVTDEILDTLIALLIQKQVITYESLRDSILESAEDARLNQPELNDAYNSRLNSLEVYQSVEKLRLAKQLFETFDKLNTINEQCGEPLYKLSQQKLKPSE